MKKYRANVPFDTEYFKKLKEKGTGFTPQETFTYIYKSNHWSGNKSISGEGSDEIQTKEIKRQLVKVISDYKIKSFLDLPCGDHNWMNTIDLNAVKYIGGDIVKDLIIDNKNKYERVNKKFFVMDIINDVLPEADLLFCRDCLVHLSNKDILKTFNNIKRSNIKYILTTTFPECETNEDIITGDWRILNLEKHPFNLPEPILLINENCTEGEGTYSDKSLGLWLTGIL
jgi:hypothetical protein